MSFFSYSQRQQILFGIVVLAWCPFTNAGNGVDPLDNFCRRWYHQSQVKNGMLFIDGGLMTFTDVKGSTSNPAVQPTWTGPITYGVNNYLVAVNMSSSWDWKQNISEVALNKAAPESTGNPVPIVQSGAMFQGPIDDSQLYLYGGVTPSINTSFSPLQWPTTDQYTLWGLDGSSDSWSQYDVFQTIPERPSWGASAEAPEQGLAFYLDGAISNYSSLTTEYLSNTVIPLKGLVVLDLKNQTAQNRSTTSIDNTGANLRGGMVYIPGIGSSGILVALGGARCTGSTCDASTFNLQSMAQVNIFDIASINTTNSDSGANGWYTQAITGTAPAPRIDFCVVVVSAPDQSSHNIYMYGGWDPTSKTLFDEIWVLSLPSHTWIKTYSGSSPRYGHTCHVVGNDQMITIGGLDSTNATDSCDWEYKSVAMYNLTGDGTAGWGSVFTANGPAYKVSKAVSTIIGGGPSGNATKLLPDGGWSSSQIANLFTRTQNQSQPVIIGGGAIPTSMSVAPPPGNSSTTAAGGNTAQITTPQPTKKSIPLIPIIVGSVAGGLALLILISITSFILHKRSVEKAKAAERITIQKIAPKPAPTPAPTPIPIPIPIPIHEVSVDVERNEENLQNLVRKESPAIAPKAQMEEVIWDRHSAWAEPVMYEMDGHGLVEADPQNHSSWV